MNARKSFAARHVQSVAAAGESDIRRGGESAAKVTKTIVTLCKSSEKDPIKKDSENDSKRENESIRKRRRIKTKTRKNHSLF